LELRSIFLLLLPDRKQASQMFSSVELQLTTEDEGHSRDHPPLGQIVNLHRLCHRIANKACSLRVSVVGKIKPNRTFVGCLAVFEVLVKKYLVILRTVTK
jgi:hypothetical protein